ncbi:MAG: anthranilate synthase component I [Verrucomicrobia bacterium]|nr:anthranilate synthase component I [Verrucomicrobiota bacterium]
MADCETPVAAFQKLLDADEDAGGEGGYAFLLESAEKSDQIGRYSFLGSRPAAIFESRGREITITESHQPPRIFTTATDPLAELQRFMARYRSVPPADGDTTPFLGGAVGFLGYDTVRFFEPTVPPPPPDDLGLPEMLFVVTDTLLVFDHRHRRLRLVANVFLQEGIDPDGAYHEAQAKLLRLLRRLLAPSTLRPVAPLPEMSAHGLAAATAALSNTTRAEFEAVVARGQEYIRAGDIFQFVPSQRFEAAFPAEPLALYRALRFINPSPYMFILKCGSRFSLVGSSPEIHVRAQHGNVEIRPIAGTRRRGRDVAEDAALAVELLGDPKERAEHLMLVDLARNDVGRIAEWGSVRVTDFMTIERYSHVMHIVSHVGGRLRADLSAFDVMRATFPAGTVSGSPKVRAMQIINELEKNKRGAYAGAVGYFGFDGNLDSCIALRTVVLQGGRAYVQAGGGVVADSTPAGEYEETVNKARGVLRAVEFARQMES